MKANYCHKRLTKVVFLLLFICTIPHLTFAETTPTQNFEQSLHELHFTPLKTDSKIAIAKDKEGISWLQIPLSSELLNKPLILQFPSIHVNKYCVYIKQKDKWLKVIPNTDQNGGDITPQFQENHFTTAYPTIYIISKNQYINDGNFTLVDRGNFRSVILSGLLKLEIFYSLYLISIAINIGLYFIFREKITLLYSLFITSIIIICLLEDGLFYFLSKGHYDKTCLLAILVPFSCSLFILFLYNFVEKKPLSRKLKYTYTGLVTLFILLASCYYITRYDIYFMILVNSALGAALLTISLALFYIKRDLSIRLIAYSFSIVAITAIAYYLSIYNDNNVFAFINMTMIRSILAIAFILSGYALWIKVKRLKLAHDGLKTEHNDLKEELEYLKDIQAKSIYEDLLNKTVNKGIDHNPKTMGEQITLPTIDATLRDKYLCTDREIDVLNCIWKGMTNQEIAEKLSISLSTVKQHVSNVYSKLDVKNRSQAMVLKMKL